MKKEEYGLKNLKSDLKTFLREKKMRLLEEYEEALDYNRLYQARNLRVRLVFIDELLKEVE